MIATAFLLTILSGSCLQCSDSPIKGVQIVEAEEISPHNALMIIDKLMILKELNSG